MGKGLAPLLCDILRPILTGGEVSSSLAIITTKTSLDTKSIKKKKKRKKTRDD
jgi:hypothetical protein